MHGAAGFVHGLLDRLTLADAVHQALDPVGVLPAALRQGDDILISRVSFGIVDGRERHQPVEQVRADRLSDGGLFAGEIEDIVHDLEGHAHFITKHFHRGTHLLFFRSDHTGSE